MVSKISQSLILTLTLLVAVSCTKKSEAPQDTNNQPQSAVKELRIFTWSQYFDDEILKKFEAETGAKVKADYFSNNEQMLAKLEVSAKGAEEGYDLILPSDYMVRNLIQLKLIQSLDKSKLTFLNDFEKEALNPEYDPGLKYSVPMAIGTTGVAINTKLLPNLKSGDISWKEIFENPAYAGKVTLLEDTKEVLQVALFIQGKNLGTATEADIKKAFEYLKAHKKQIKAFTEETRPVIEADECAICMVYSGDALSLAKTKSDLRFVIPKEGASIWTDNFAIPANAKNAELAYALMNKILSPEGAKAFTERTGYRTANKKARTLLPNDIANSQVIYPNAAEQKRLHFLVDKKEFSLLIDKEWTLLKTE